MNADKRLALLNLLRLGKGSCPIGKHPRKKLLTRGASYKPPALPGDTYLPQNAYLLFLPPTSLYVYVIHR